MKLANSHLAIVEARKVAEYLLNASHPENGGKARFFEGLGYSALDVMPLVAALRTVAVTGEAVGRIASRHGTKFIVEGKLPSQVEASKNRAIRTVWIVESADEVPRLVTAYPHEGESTR